LLLELQEQASLVIVDSPSADIADAQVLASKADAVLLVVRSGRTHAEWAQATIKRFQLVGARLVGVVLSMPPRDFAVHLPLLSRTKTRSLKEKNSPVVASEIDDVSISSS
jgi:Mrp family chromosome partitioning ATPase